MEGVATRRTEAVVTSDRFKWLEFEEEGGSAAPAAALRGRAPDGGKDERWHLAEAERAFIDGEFEPALRHYSAALKYRPDLAEAWAGQARCMSILEQAPLALKWGQQGLERVPTSLAMASALSSVLAHAEQIEAAMNLSEQIMKADETTLSTHPEIWIDRGTCLLAGGNEDSAARCFERAADIAENDPDWLQRIGHAYLRGNAPSRALKALEQALELRSDRAFLWILVGQTAARLHLNDRASEAFKQAHTLDPIHPELKKETVVTRGADPRRPCWIATLVFASDTHPVVTSLRGWRDEIWMPTRLGRLAATVYDRTAPRICRVLARRPALHAPLRTVLTALSRRIRRAPRIPPTPTREALP